MRSSIFTGDTDWKDYMVECDFQQTDGVPTIFMLRENPLGRGYYVNVRGNLVRTIPPTGSNNRLKFKWDGRDRTGGLCASGVYFCRF